MSQSLINEAVCIELSNLFFEFCRRLGSSLSAVASITEEDLSELVTAYRGLTGEPTYQLPNPLEAWKQHYKTILKLARLAHPKVRECVGSFNKLMASFKNARDEQGVKAILDSLKADVHKMEQVPQGFKDIVVVLLPRITQLLSLAAKSGHHLAKENSTNPRFRDALPDIQSHLILILSKAGKDVKYKEVHREITYWAGAIPHLITFMEGKSMAVVDIHGEKSIVRRSELEREMKVMLSMEMDMRYHNHFLGSTSKTLLVAYDSVPLDWYSFLSNDPRVVAQGGGPAARRDVEGLEAQLRQANLGADSQPPDPRPAQDRRTRIAWRPPAEVEEASIVFEGRGASNGGAGAEEGSGLQDQSFELDRDVEPPPLEEPFGLKYELDVLRQNFDPEIEAISFNPLSSSVNMHNNLRLKYKELRQVVKMRKEEYEMLKAEYESVKAEYEAANADGPRAHPNITEAECELKMSHNDVRDGSKLVNGLHDLIKAYKTTIESERQLRRVIPRQDIIKHEDGVWQMRDGIWGVMATRGGLASEVVWYDQHGREILWITPPRAVPTQEGLHICIHDDNEPIMQNAQGHWGVRFRDDDQNVIIKWYLPDGSPLF